MLRPALARKAAGTTRPGVRRELPPDRRKRPFNLDDMFDYLAEAGDVTWRPSVPDALKGSLVNAATETQKTDSPIRSPGKPATPARKQ